MQCCGASWCKHSCKARFDQLHGISPGLENLQVADVNFRTGHPTLCQVSWKRMYKSRYQGEGVLICHSLRYTTFCAVYQPLVKPSSCFLIQTTEHGNEYARAKRHPGRSFSFFWVWRWNVLLWPNCSILPCSASTLPTILCLTSPRSSATLPVLQRTCLVWPDPAEPDPVPHCRGNSELWIRKLTI